MFKLEIFLHSTQIQLTFDSSKRNKELITFEFNKPKRLSQCN